MLLDATVYDVDHGSLMLVFLFDYLFHPIARYLPIFSKQLTLITFMDADIGWVLDFSLSEQEPCAMLVYFNPRD
jgi:hypothetical protein